MTVVAELVSLLTLETDQAAFKKGETQVTNFARTIENALGADLFAGLTRGLYGYIEQADMLDDTSKALGISTDELQALGYAAQLSGSDLQDMIGALGRLNNEVGSAAAGVGAQTVLFQRLGVDVSKGLKPMSELLPEIANGIAKLPSHAERAAATVQLFGRGARALVPFLEQGEEGIKALTEEFAKLGGGFDATFIERAAEVNDELARAHVIQQRVVSTMMSGVLPAFNSFLRLSEKAVTSVADFTKGTDVMAAGLATVTALAIAQAAALSLSSGKVGAFMRLGAVIGGVAVVMDDLKKFAEGSDSALGQMLEKFKLMKPAMETLRDISAGFQEIEQHGYGGALNKASGERYQAQQAQAKAKLDRDELFEAIKRAVREGAPQSRIDAMTQRLGVLNRAAGTNIASDGDGLETRRRTQGQGLGADLQQRVYGRVSQDVLQAEAASQTVNSVLNLNIEKVEATDPKAAAEQMKKAARELHREQTEELRRGLANRVRP